MGSGLFIDERTLALLGVINKKETMAEVLASMGATPVIASAAKTG